MAVIMVNLLVQDRVTRTREENGQKITDETFGSELRAHLLLTPDGDPDLGQLGFVHLRIEAQPRSLPAMTPAATVDWLCTALTRLLATRAKAPG